jgi:tRNA modification GTPase
LRVFVEATLDFPEEEIEFLEAEHVFQQIDTLRLDINSILVKARQGSLLQEGIRLALLGLPNTGKSSLLNLLSGTEKSIVTPIAGTTRDKVEDTILINDIPIQFVDTAGLRVSEDVVEKIGIERSWEEVEKADIIIFVSDLSRVHEETYREQEDTVLRDVNKRKNNNKLLHVLNKVDLFDTQQYQELISSSYPCAHTISTKSNYGIEDLKKQIAKLAGKSENQEGVYLARHRHIRAIEHAEEHLTRASEALSTKPILLDVVAEELRLMQKCLDTILGEQTADDLLGQIFSSFCIGK